MKLFTSQQIRELDTYTIEHEPIRPIDLMERAAKAMIQVITGRWSNATPVYVFAGPGNNGGDALAVARMLAERKYTVSVYLFNIKKALSESCAINRDRLKELNTGNLTFQEIIDEFTPPNLNEGSLVIDGLFGAGINRPLGGGFAALVKLINQSQAEVASIDVPSGLMAEDNTNNIPTNIVCANLTLSLHQPKLAFFFPEYQKYIGTVQVIDIQLSAEGMRKIPAQYQTLDAYDIHNIMKKRDPFAHKGSMGNALLAAGSYGMAGAAILAAKACLRSGVGKLTVRSPRKNNDILQISVPEAILSLDASEMNFTEAIDTTPFNALGIGPGLGTKEPTAIAVISQIRRSQIPCVIDADAINVIGSHKAWMQQLPSGLILTPHPKEFDRLSDKPSKESYERLVKAQDMAEKLKAYILLKGHHSMLCTPDRQIYVNTTGNAGMATGGSGDVLLGIITAFLARGYERLHAALLGMYIHGLAGDMAAQEKGMESLIASDIIDFLPQAFKKIAKYNRE
ncbi:MAG: NAD(P)H-hydrate dehydratase [Bacteroidaceae bacterium]|nr:NAD(P)H-hydrate dehydratase [Bacteroidaceae bacterium]